MFKLLPIALALLAVSGTYAELRLLTKTRLSAPAAISATDTNTVSDDEMTSAGDAGKDGDAAATSAAPAPTPAARTAILLSSTKLAPTIRHHILPAQTIPLPITISARPGLRTVIAPETITIQQTGIAKVGEVVQKIPTAVSHQSQTVVHKHANVVTPIVAPAVRTITSQLVNAYHTPLVYATDDSIVRILKH